MLLPLGPGSRMGAAVRIRQRFAYPFPLSQSGVRCTVFEGHLGAGDRPDAGELRGMRELERAVDPVVVGERERLVAELGREPRAPRGDAPSRKL